LKSTDLGNLNEMRKAGPYVSKKYQQTAIHTIRSVQNVTIQDMGIRDPTSGKHYSHEYSLVYATMKATKSIYRLKKC
jgi:hypothetical protein